MMGRFQIHNRNIWKTQPAFFSSAPAAPPRPHQKEPGPPSSTNTMGNSSIFSYFLKQSPFSHHFQLLGAEAEHHLRLTSKRTTACARGHARVRRRHHSPEEDWNWYSWSFLSDFERWFSVPFYGTDQTSQVSESDGSSISSFLRFCCCWSVALCETTDIFSNLQKQLVQEGFFFFN